MVIEVAIVGIDPSPHNISKYNEIKDHDVLIKVQKAKHLRLTHDPSPLWEFVRMKKGNQSLKFWVDLSELAPYHQKGNNQAEIAH